MKILLTLLLSLMVTTPALADYSGSVSLDWSSLTFSAPVDLIPRYQQQGAYLFDAAQTVPLGTSSFGFPAGTIKGTSEIVPFPDMGWSAQTAAVTMPDVGTVSAVFSPTQLVSSASLSGVGYASSAADVNGFLVAHQTGTLTVSIGYTIAHEFAPSGTGVVPDFSAQSHLQLIVTDSTGLFQAALKDQSAPAGTSTESGVLSVTQHVIAGAQNYFTVSTALDVNHPVASSVVQSVPVPGTLWFLGSGLVLLVVWRARRRV
jgi:hypothetical protein